MHIGESPPVSHAPRRSSNACNQTTVLHSFQDSYPKLPNLLCSRGVEDGFVVVESNDEK